MKKYFLIALATLLCFSCKEDIQNADMSIQYDTALGIPLGKAKFNIADILEKSYKGEDIYADNTGRYFFIMEDTAAFALRNIQFLPPTKPQVSSGETLKFSDYLSGVSIPAEGVDVSIISPANRKVTIQKQNFISFPVQVNSTDQRIDSAGIAHSELFIRIEKQSNATINIKKFKINFPFRDEKTGEKISIEIPNAKFDKDSTFIIDDFMVGIEQNPDNSNEGGFKFDVEIEAELEDGTLYNGDAIKYTVTYTIFDYKVVYGNFQPDPAIAKTRAQLDFNLLRDINNGKNEGLLLFEDIDVLLTLKNYDIGMRVNLTLDTMKGFERDHLERGYKYAMFDGGANYGTSSSFTTRPEKPFTGIPSIMTMRFNKDNGQIQNMFTKDFLSDRFELVFSVGSVTTSPSDPPVFITNKAAIECGVKFTVPLNLRPESYYIYTDTIQGFAESIDEGIFQYIDKAELNIGLENGLPIGAKISLKLIDENGNEIKSDLTNNEWYSPKAETNEAGEVKKETVNPKDFRITLSESTMNDLKNAKHILYTVHAFNEDITDNICFKDDNRFNIVLSIYAEGGYNGNLTNNNAEQ